MNRIAILKRSTRFLLFLTYGLACGLSGSTVFAQTDTTPMRGNTGAQSSVPVLLNTCLITNDVKKLSDFYAQVLQAEPRNSGDDYVEFLTGAGRLALFSARAQEKYIPGSATAGQNHSATLEFRVRNVDQEYARLQAIVKTWVKGPTNQPWGTRSIYFRDPDGNLVDFFAPVNVP